MKTLTPAETWTDLDVPEDGVDYQLASSFTDGVGFQDCADRTEYLKAITLGSGVTPPAIDSLSGIGRIRSVASTTDLMAITPAEGDVYEVRAANGSGALYVGTTSTALTHDGVFVLQPGTGTGRWVSVNHSQVGVNNGLAPLNGSGRVAITRLPSVNYDKSISSGSGWSESSTTPSLIDNMAVALTIGTELRPVRIVTVPDGSANVASIGVTGAAYFELRKSFAGGAATTIAKWITNSGSPNFCDLWVEPTEGAGTYAYELWGCGLNPGDSVSVSWVRMIAHQL